jgi:hypothetical protein
MMRLSTGDEVARKNTIVDLEPGERVKIIIDGVCLTGEVVARSKQNRDEWIVRTYFHDMLAIVDNIYIISERREKFYQDFFKHGTVVEVHDRKAKRVGIIVDSFMQEFDDESFVYIPIVLVGTSMRPCAPETLRIIQCDNMRDDPGSWVAGASA